MSTNGTIAKVSGDGFQGVYHHWDSYPSGLGKTLYDLYHGHFDHNLSRMLSTLIDAHPAGWSTIEECNFDLDAGYTGLLTSSDRKAGKQQGPQCYCHGTRNEEVNVITHENALECGCEYAYVFAVDGQGEPIMNICSPHRDNRLDDPTVTWKIISRVYLNDSEPDWEQIDWKQTAIEILIAGSHEPEKRRR